MATRPLHQNADWSSRLRDCGYEVVDLPLLDILAVDDAQHAVAKTKILNLDEYSKVIFVSQNAVDYALPLIDQYWPALPEQTTWFSVGARTAQHLQSKFFDYFHLSPEILADEYEMNSESLLARTEFHNVRDEKILIVRGVGGRPLIADCLTQRGATVHHCELYLRALPADSRVTIQQLSCSSKDILPVFSAESLNNFVTLSQETGKAEVSEKYTQLQVIVPSERVAKSAETLGFNHVYCATNASEEAMLAAIASVTSS